MKRHRISIGLVFTAAVALSSQTALATCLPEITEVQIELPEVAEEEVVNGGYQVKLYIFGECLGSENLRAVLTQGQMGMFKPLETVGQDANMIEAILPGLVGAWEPKEVVEVLEERLAPGEYLLKLQYNAAARWGSHQWRDTPAKWDLTIGALPVTATEGLNGVIAAKVSIRQLMKLFQQAEENFNRELAEMQIETTVGGGLVSVTMNGHKRVGAVTIDPEVMDPENPEFLAELIRAAVNECANEVEEEIQRKVDDWLHGTKGVTH